MITCILPCLGSQKKNLECPQFDPFKYYLPMPTVSGKKSKLEWWNPIWQAPKVFT